jgi:seryl-tRNA synthetase
MIDIKLIKENPEEIIRRFAVKGKDAREEITKILELDGKRRALISETEALKAEQNRENKLIPQYKKEKKDVKEIFAKLKELGAKSKAIDVELKEIEAEYKRISDAYNVPLEEVKNMVQSDDIAADLKVKKAVDFVKENAVITETAE